jgi:hypothetical protein
MGNTTSQNSNELTEVRKIRELLNRNTETEQKGSSADAVEPAGGGGGGGAGAGPGADSELQKMIKSLSENSPQIVKELTDFNTKVYGSPEEKMEAYKQLIKKILESQIPIPTPTKEEILRLIQLTKKEVKPIKFSHGLGTLIELIKKEFNNILRRWDIQQDGNPKKPVIDASKKALENKGILSGEERKNLRDVIDPDSVYNEERRLILLLDRYDAHLKSASYLNEDENLASLRKLLRGQRAIKLTPEEELMYALARVVPIEKAAALLPIGKRLELAKAGEERAYGRPDLGGLGAALVAPQKPKPGDPYDWERVLGERYKPEAGSMRTAVRESPGPPGGPRPGGGSYVQEYTPAYPALPSKLNGADGAVPLLQGVVPEAMEIINKANAQGRELTLSEAKNIMRLINIRK